jgi:hypothetical protein
MSSRDFIYSFIKVYLKPIFSQMWQYITVIPTLRRQRQEYCEFEASLGYIVTPLTQKNKTKQ